MNSPLAGNAMFTILVFQTKEDLDHFIAGSAPSKTSGIELRVVAPHVLLVTRDSVVTNEHWQRFHGMGYNAVHGRFVKLWHETHGLMRDSLSDLTASQTRYIEAYSGDDCRIIAPAPD